jgi:quinol monooxygenase YgiN
LLAHLGTPLVLNAIFLLLLSGPDKRKHNSQSLQFTERTLDLTIELKSRPGKAQELQQAIQTFLPAMRKEKGCWDSRIFLNTEDGENFLLSIQWDDIAALEQYMLSNNGSVILGAFDLLGETVKVRVGSENFWGGIEVLKRMRSNP